ncbi:MAG: hypothetical protein WDZ28_05565 [Simkaniaceae bacterium]
MSKVPNFDSRQMALNAIFQSEVLDEDNEIFFNDGLKNIIEGYREKDDQVNDIYNRHLGYLRSFNFIENLEEGTLEDRINQEYSFYKRTIHLSFKDNEQNGHPINLTLFRSHFQWKVYSISICCPHLDYLDLKSHEKQSEQDFPELKNYREKIYEMRENHLNGIRDIANNYLDKELNNISLMNKCARVFSSYVYFYSPMTLYFFCLVLTYILSVVGICMTPSLLSSVPILTLCLALWINELCEENKQKDIG